MFRWLVNAGLLAIPVGGSVGALLGIDAWRQSTGQAPLFSGGSGGGGPGSGGNGGSGGGSTGGGSGGNGSTTNNGLTNTQYCELSYGISPPSKGESFTLNPNQWGVTPSTVGSLCMNVTTFNNETYPTRTTAPEFSVTWQFDPGSTSQPVHAFPNIMVDNVLPVELQKMHQFNLDFHWTYGIGVTTAKSTDVSQIDGSGVNTNVAIDMFFDSNSQTAQNSATAKYEVMVWFAKFGPAAQPIGLSAGPVTSRVLNGTTFNLYTGQNSNGQNVLTWLVSGATENFTGDIYPLISDLYSLNGEIYPSRSDYLGIFSLGTEAFFSNTNVTFWVPTLSIDIQA